METSKLDIIAKCKEKYVALRQLGMWAIFLFFNFFLIVMTLYQLKPASRSLFIEYVGAARLPYVWIITAITMIIFISYYHRWVERYSRLNVVLGTSLISSGLLILFRFLFHFPGPAVPMCFYVF